MTYLLRDNAHIPGQWEPRWIGEFDTLDSARRYVIDNRLRFWSIFRGEEHIESACTHFIPGIDDKEAA